MGYCDYTDAWVFELTRQRRREAAERRAARPCIRVRATLETPEFDPAFSWSARRGKALDLASSRSARRQAKKLEREKRRATNMRRRKPEVVRGNNLPIRVFNALWLVQEGRCYLCAAPFTDDDWSTEDHVEPWARGGRNANNLLLAHQGCNTDKASRPPRPCEVLYLSAALLRIPAAIDATEQALAA